VWNSVFVDNYSIQQRTTIRILYRGVAIYNYTVGRPTSITTVYDSPLQWRYSTIRRIAKKSIVLLEGINLSFRKPLINQCGINNWKTFGFKVFFFPSCSSVLFFLTENKKKFVQDVSDAPAHSDSGNPQYSARWGLPIIAVFAHIILQGYSEVESL